LEVAVNVVPGLDQVIWVRVVAVLLLTVAAGIGVGGPLRVARAYAVRRRHLVRRGRLEQAKRLALTWALGLVALAVGLASLALTFLVPASPARLVVDLLGVLSYLAAAGLFIWAATAVMNELRPPPEGGDSQ
jgi:hypothetical protein